jgi:phosphoglucomutase
VTHTGGKLKPTPFDPPGAPAAMPYALWIDVPRLVTAHYTDMPAPSVPAQRVTFGTSGHRGSALTRSFNIRFDVAFACDTDHDRHGIVTRSDGLLPPNHYLAVLVDYLSAHRSRWPARAAIGKSVVCSGMIDRVARARDREVYEVPVGFKWFVGGLLDGTLGFAGEESAGATCLQLDGQPWTTDKDGIVPALLSAEMTIRTGRDPAELYRGLAHQFGASAERRGQATATREQRALLARLTPHQFTHTELAGEAIVRILDRASGNRAAIGGIKVMTEHGWFVARPSGTEDLYRIYAESFNGEDHVARIVSDA